MQKLRILAVGMLVVVWSALALAQTGSIQGTVTDNSGAVVQGAQVTVRSVETNAMRTVSTSGTGVYSLPNLPVGHYDITAKKESFKVYRLENIQLTVAQALGLDITLDPGTVTEEVVVKASDVPPVDLETSQISNLVDSRTMKDLPLLTRNPYDLLLLSPGTAVTNALGGYTVNGQRERNNNFLLDGVDNNDTSVPGGQGSIVLSSSPESAQEFRVITDTFNAEFGRNTGAIVDVVSKSGTNSFHGDAYEFGRWSWLGGARDWFNHNIDPETGKMERINPYNRNQFGYSFGGPIRKNKTFFFFNQELQRFRTTLTNQATVPTREFKTGVFNAVTVDQNNQPLPVTVDLSQSSTQNIYGLAADPTSANVLALLPLPTLASGDGYTGQLFFPSADIQNSYQTILKLDHHLNDKHVVTVRLGYDHYQDPNAGHFDILPGAIGGQDEKAISKGLSANLVSTLSARLINNFNFGVNHIFAGFKCKGLDKLDSVNPLDKFGRGWDYLTDPYTGFGCISMASDLQFRDTSTTSYSDDLTWVRGSHTLKFGADLRSIGESGPDAFYTRRQLTMQPGILFGFNLLDLGANAGFDPFINDAAALYYGLVTGDLNAEFFSKGGSQRVPLDDRHFRQHEYSFFAQDSWKVRRTLTLSLGLRYQFNSVPYEENANFSNLLTDPWTFPTPVTFTIVGPGTGKMLYNNDYSGIEPRIGFSYDPKGDGKTAIRGAFGLFHDRVFGNLFGNARGNPPFEQDWSTEPFDTLAGNNALGFGVFALPAAPDTTPSAMVPDGSQLTTPVIFDTHFRNATSASWNFGVQRDIGWNSVLDVAYVGTKGSHIYRVVDGTPPVPALVTSLLAACDGVTPFTNVFGQSTTCSASDVVKGNLYTGYDNGFLPFNAIPNNALSQPSYNRSISSSIYHGLQAKFTHRFSHGLQFQGSYTWSHAIDDAGDPLRPGAGNRSFPRNSRALSQERGNSDNDIRHVGVINYIYELPFGRGKGYASQGAVGKVLEGFQFGGIVTLQTGHAFDMYSVTDSQRAGVSNRPDLSGNPFAPGANTGFTLGKVFFSNPDAFLEPPYGRAGNLGRNYFHGPNYVDFDLSAAKKMKFGERVGLEARFECFNVFNHPQFNVPGSDSGALGNRTFSGLTGIILSTLTREDGTTSARQMQVALKLSF
jgi:hypothetical protein